jgi:hypothetical protein
MGAVLGIIETYLAEYSPRITILSYACLSTLAAICSIFIKEDLKKTRAALEQEERAKFTLAEEMAR